MSSDMKIFTVDKFLGINESADGYTELKMGEASKMENWAITDAFNITLRPGIQRIDPEGDIRPTGEIIAAWAGYTGESEYLVVVDIEDGTDIIWMYVKGTDRQYVLAHTQTGALGLSTGENAYTKIFTFAGKLYIMSAGNTVVYNGAEFAPEEPYIPLVVTGASPSGGGTTLENLNMLTGKRRIDYSADGESADYVLPEEATSVLSVTVDNVTYAPSEQGTFSGDTHTFTFSEPPVKGVGNVAFTYDTDAAAAEEYRMKVVKMPLTENYNGSTDTRLFVAGDGSNICFYTGVIESGDVTALYFPAMNEVAVDMSGSPVTGLVRHYNKLLVFKPDGAYTITYEPVTLTDGSTIAGFYLRSANREFGNEAFGQVQTVNNYPRTFCKSGLYEWRITSSYYRDERYAVRVSAAVERSLSEADPKKIVTCDDNFNKTYYIFLNDAEGTVLVNRYALSKEGLWCIYKSDLCRNVQYALMHGGTMAIVTESGLFYFNEDAATDASPVFGEESRKIVAVWESGHMAFGADYRQKYSSKIYLSMLPETSSSLTVTASTDRWESYMEKTVGTNLFSFSRMDFRHFSFNMNDTPKIQRVRLKVKKFVYYKLIFKVEEFGCRATVLGFDQQVRFSSMVK